jgi:hypothetical protein
MNFNSEETIETLVVEMGTLLISDQTPGRTRHLEPDTWNQTPGTLDRSPEFKDQSQKCTLIINTLESLTRIQQKQVFKKCQKI